MPPGRLRGRMTVKDRVGRVRYVAFRLGDGSLHRQQLAGALPPGARLTRFDGVHGVLRTTHREAAALRERLARPLRVAGKDVAVETLATSGTLRAAAAALPEGAEARRPQRRRRGTGQPATQSSTPEDRLK